MNFVGWLVFWCINKIEYWQVNVGIWCFWGYLGHRAAFLGFSGFGYVGAEYWDWFGFKDDLDLGLGLVGVWVGGVGYLGFGVVAFGF